jgi:glycerol-3-phosphate dehydrogenase
MTPAEPLWDVMAERAATLQRLAGERWDVVVVGGGIVGCGVLLDATSRGLRAALVEQDDIAAGTSSRSSRLIHGGLRYLEHLDVRLVREALRERSRLLELAPHLVRLEPFLFPVYGWPLVHRAFYGAGLVMYDLLGAARDGGRAHHLSAEAVTELAPPIRRAGLRGGIAYHDGIEDDARYCLTVARTAIDHGAVVATRLRAEALLDRGTDLEGILVHDVVRGDRFEIRARHVIDATGVWLGHPGRRLGGSTLQLVPSRGTHLLFERTRLPLRMGMSLRIPRRLLFIVPLTDAWLVGTTDVPYDGPPERPSPTASDADHILENVNRVLDVDLRREDAIGAFAGLRPLVAVPRARGDTARLSREHTIQREASGLVRVSGGKYTTYRIMARDAVDVALAGHGAIPPSGTEDLTLVGAAARADLAQLARELTAEPGLDARSARSLVDRHGTRARDVLALARQAGLSGVLGDGPHLEAEVAWAVHAELALSIDDVLTRRLRTTMSRRDRGARIAPRVAAIMGAALGWDEARQRVEVEAFLAGAGREYGVPGASEARLEPGPATVGAGA